VCIYNILVYMSVVHELVQKKKRKYVVYACDPTHTHIDIRSVYAGQNHVADTKLFS
jgi:hypothetical protein